MSNTSRKILFQVLPLIYLYIFTITKIYWLSIYYLLLQVVDETFSTKILKYRKDLFVSLPMGIKHQKTKSNTICEIKLLLLLSLKLTIYSYINFIVFLFYGFNVLTFSQNKRNRPNEKKIQTDLSFPSEKKRIR